MKMFITNVAGSDFEGLPAPSTLDKPKNTVITGEGLPAPSTLNEPLPNNQGNPPKTGSDVEPLPLPTTL